MYLRIVNPLTNRKVNINSKLGKIIVKKYINNLKKEGGSVADKEESSKLFQGEIQIRSDSSDSIVIPPRRVTSDKGPSTTEVIEPVPRTLTSEDKSNITDETESEIKSKYNRLHLYDRGGRAAGQLSPIKTRLFGELVPYNGVTLHESIELNQYGVVIPTAFLNRTGTEPGYEHKSLGLYGTISRDMYYLDSIIKINKIKDSFIKKHIISYALRNPIDEHQRESLLGYNPLNLLEERSAPIRDENPVSDHNALVSEFLCIDNKIFTIITFNLQGFSHFDKDRLTEQFSTKLDNFMYTIGNYLSEERIIFLFQEIVLREGKHHVDLIIQALKDRINSYLDNKNLGLTRPNYVFIYDGFTSMIMYNRNCFQLNILQIIPRIKYGNDFNIEYDTDDKLSVQDVHKYGQIARNSIPHDTLIRQFNETSVFLGDPDLGRGKMSNAYEFSIKIFGSLHQFVVVNVHLKAAPLGDWAKTHEPEIRNILCRVKDLSGNYNNTVFLAGDFNAFCENKARYIKNHLAVVMADNNNCNGLSRIPKPFTVESVELKGREDSFEEVVVA